MSFDWRALGRCRKETSVDFFPTSELDMWTKEAKAVCAQCPVKSHCLEWAIPQPDLYGVFGGTTFRQRQRIRQAQKKSA